MRPGSRGFGMPPGTAGQPPGTGMRPGSGMRRPPGTAQRLRTGVAPTGPGLQAAQGLSISANVNVQDRPMTGQGVKGMQAKGLNAGPGGRLVEDAAYYVGLLRKKMTDVTNETRKLRIEIEQSSKESSSYNSLERKYETLVKEKEKLEGQLADYNLAMDKARTSTDPEEVQELALHLGEKNRQVGQEVDRLFKSRKQKEEETIRLEEQIEAQYRAIQQRINELDPGRLRAYNDLMAKQREFQDRALQNESRLNEINARIRQSESDDKTNVNRKEYASLEKQYQTLKRDAEALAEELEIAGLEPKEAHTKFVARVNNFKQITKNLEDKTQQMKNELVSMKKSIEDLDSTAADEDQGDAAKYELLQKRDAEMTAFMDKFEETRTQIIQEQGQVKEVVVALLEHVSKGIEDSTNLPSQEAFGEMEETKTFKERNLATAQRTMEGLQAEHRKRLRELELLQNSKPKLDEELRGLRDRIARMNKEMQDFEDVEGVRRAFERTRSTLQELKHSYSKRRDTMRDQVRSLTNEHESLKKQLGQHEAAKELDDAEKRLKHNERTIFELKEFVITKERETDYESIKIKCGKMIDNMNSIAIRKAQGDGGYK